MLGLNLVMSYRCANLQRCILYIYSTNIRTGYFKHAAHSPFFFSSKCRLFHNATFVGSCVILLHTGCAKIKKNLAPKGYYTTGIYTYWRGMTVGANINEFG